MTVQLEEKTIEEIIEITNFINVFLNSEMKEEDKFDLGLISIELEVKTKQFYKQRDELKNRKIKESGIESEEIKGLAAEKIIKEITKDLQPILDKKFKVEIPMYSKEEFKKILSNESNKIKTDQNFWSLAKNCIKK